VFALILEKENQQREDYMQDSSSKNVLSGFAYYLAEAGVLDKSLALSVLQQTIASKESYIDSLVKQKLVDESRVAQAASEYFGFPLCDITAFNVDLIPPELLGMQLVKKRLALPLFKKNGLLYLAITDPTIENLYEIRFLTGSDVRFFIVESSDLIELVDGLLNKLILTEITNFGEDQLDNITVDAYKEENADLATKEVESAPVDAFEKGASDVHFERYENTYRIRFRQHGILYPIDAPPLKLANYLLARIKVISNLDITEHRIPQDGRFKLIISKKRSIDFRVSVCPTLFGEKIVLRILDTASVFQGVEKLGMHQVQKDNFLNALQRSQGLILVTGPTGSGKTVTLYSALSYLNSVEKNISTVEDPVEIPMQGINQVHVNPRAGLTFATALRSFLRQDPDIIMVGEIRDLETAEIAVKAAQTGHLVLSTLHTNSAPETITRLMNMGVPPYNLATSLAIVIAQRLVRVLCDLCKVREEFPLDVILKEGFVEEDFSTLKFYGPLGCDRCSKGYKGRMGIFEVMPVSSEMSNLIMQGGNTIEIASLAKKEGVTSLRDAGLQKVREGVTSLIELNRVFR
jgi:type IV pilus assembly protein PilB